MFTDRRRHAGVVRRLAALRALEGPQRAAMRPTWTANGLRTAKLPTNDGSGEGDAPGSAPGRRSRQPRRPRNKIENIQLPLDVFAAGVRGWCLGYERMRTMPDDTTQRCHRLAPQDRRPRRRPAGPRSGRSIPPIRSDLVGEADTLLAATQPARPILAYPPPNFSPSDTSCRSLTARAERATGAFGFSTAVPAARATRHASVSPTADPDGRISTRPLSPALLAFPETGHSCARHTREEAQ